MVPCIQNRIRSLHRTQSNVFFRLYDLDRGYLELIGFHRAEMRLLNPLPEILLEDEIGQGLESSILHADERLIICVGKRREPNRKIQSDVPDVLCTEAYHKRGFASDRFERHINGLEPGFQIRGTAVFITERKVAVGIASCPGKRRTDFRFQPARSFCSFSG